MKLIKTDYMTPYQMKELEHLGFIVTRVKPMKINKIGYLVTISVYDPDSLCSKRP